MALVTSGCAPTYPKEGVPEAIKQLCQQEYGVDVQVKIVNQTIGVYVPLERFFETPVDLSTPKGILDLLSGNIRLAQEVGEQLDGVILSTTRVVLSTNLPLQFYVVMALDRKTGAGIVLTRHIEDIKRFMMGDISRGEFVYRMLLDMRYYPLSQFRGEDFPLEEVKLGAFLAQQIAHRIKIRLETDQVLAGRYQTNAVRGLYAEQAQEVHFTLDVEDRRSLPEELTAQMDEALVPVALEEAATILRLYRFGQYQRVTIQLSGLRQVKTYTRAEVERHRKKWPWAQRR